MTPLFVLAFFMTGMIAVIVATLCVAKVLVDRGHPDAANGVATTLFVLGTVAVTVTAGELLA